MNLQMITILLSAILLIYHQITTWAPLFPWNDLQKNTFFERLVESFFNGVLMSIGMICLIINNSNFTYWYPLIYYPFLFMGECIDWWIPYFSESFAKARKIWDYEKRFARTFKLIPHIKGKRTPDANHIVLHFLTVLTVICVYIYRFFVLK